MPFWLSDPSISVYLICGVLLIIFGALWLREPSRKGLIRLVIAVIPLVVVLLCDMLFESPREEAVRRMKAMADATVSRNHTELASHVSESFQFKGLDKRAIIAKAKQAETMSEWQGANVWDFDRSEAKYVDAKTVQIGFLVAGIGYSTPPFWCIATFKKDADGQFRLATFTFYNAMQKDKSSEMTIPGLG